MHRRGQEYNLAQLEKMLQTGRSRLMVLERKRSKHLRHVDALNAQIVALGGSMRMQGGRVRNKVGLNDSIAMILKRTGVPMQVAEIVRRVLKTGYASNSANFRGIVNQALIKDERFAKGGSRGSYKLKK